MQQERAEQSIRPASEHDLEAILYIYNDAILHTTAVYSYTPHTIAMRMEWWQQKKNAGLPVWVAVVDNEIAGFCTYGPFRAWPAYQYTVETSVYVHPGFRGMGLARRLCETMISYACQHKVHTIVAGIDAENSASIKLHERLGFNEVAHFKEVGYKFGKWLDLIFLQRVLENEINPTEA